MLLPILGSLTVAHADTLVVLRGSAERWHDPAIGSVYRQGGLMGGVGVFVGHVGQQPEDVDEPGLDERAPAIERDVAQNRAICPLATVLAHELL